MTDSLHDPPQRVDGLLYMARHVNDKRAIVVFDRAARKLGVASYKRLLDTKATVAAMTDLQIDLDFP